MMPTTQLLTIAVLNRIDNRLAIWHVNVGPDLGLSRLSGAWVLDIERTAEIGSLINGRHTIDCVAGLELPEGVAAAGRLDIDAMAAAVRAEIDSTDALFTEHIVGMPKSKQPIRPAWLTVVYPANVSTLTQRVETVVGPALATAHSLKDLAVCWFEFETLRVAPRDNGRPRPFLIERGGPDIRPYH
ncbi:hypothetical protein AB0E01_35230 [Nocardia vinacea]|uniref:hypothetical protein n=1 Tax=Nocardia vinacea TaxID=96468 RepID=UPI0033DF04E5